MSHTSIQQPELARPGLRKEFRRIDYEIWLWTNGQQVSKRQVKEYAKEAFEKAGIPQFKASDGWYRRWMARWGRNKDDLTKNSSTEKTDTTSIRLNNLPPEENADSSPSTSKEPSKMTLSPKDCTKPQRRRAAERQKSDYPSAVGRDSISTTHQNIISQDLAENSELNEQTGNKSAAVVLPKKKIERYLPHFKTKVVSYALKYSIKDAVYNYKVNKSTIADWIRDEQNGAEMNDGAVQIEVRPDHDFVEWLQRERKSGRLITKDLLLSKFKELTSYNKDLATKKAVWFYKYVDRFSDETSTTKTHIMYPTSFKREIAKLCRKWSKKTIARVFNVDRKRITNWVEQYSKDNYAQTVRKVSCYLTDDKIDAELWKWYSSKFPKPNSKQIRDKAVKMYRLGGYNEINCSPGWYYRWRKRYMLPSSSTEKKEFDDQLICWILAELDNNKSVTHAQLISQATEIKGDGFKLSPSWIVRFLKRYSSFIQKCPSIGVKLPSQLEVEVSAFQEDLLRVINCNSIGLDCILAFDEVPLNFSTSGNQQPKYILRKSGFENCHASLILVCTASGELLPTTLILKSEDDSDEVNLNFHLNVAYQQQGVADVALLKNWLNTLKQTFEKPYVMICDSYSPHSELLNVNTESLVDGSSKLMLIPSGCSSRLLPTLFGINEEFKSAVAFHWEKWLQETCWNIGNPVKLPSSRNVQNWVSMAHQKCSFELKDVIKDGFSNVLNKT